MRTSGILMPIFSLPTRYGIGTLGQEAYDFVLFLEKAGQSYWQILPLNPTSYGDSPYQSFSSAAGNPYFIDLDTLAADGLLETSDYAEVDFGDDPTAVDYGKLYDNRLPVLRKAFARFDRDSADFAAFCAEADWLEEYALFMALKDAHGGASWRDWPDALRTRDRRALEKARAAYADDLAFYRFLQYEFYRQWNRLKRFANQHGVRIIGDIPIYIADDSADVWSNTDQFLLDENRTPTVVAGCPPDAFSEDGQLWGMLVYNWEAMKTDDVPYAWWRRRMKHALALYDVVRIDHFRGFESFYCIPYGETSAKNGSWAKGPGMDLFHALQEEFGENLPIIAEDLGFLTEDVRALLRESGFPGMKLLQCAFDGDGDNDYLPHNYNRNCVVYTGTHDNDTILGWAQTAPAADVETARRYLHVDENEGFNWAMMRAALMSVADTAILMMPDLIGLGSEGRINTPSTLGDNWKWRIQQGCINDWLAGIIRENTALYGRAPKPDLFRYPTE